MLNTEDLENKLNSHHLVKPRLATLAMAEKLNPDFKTPHIIGGYLRNIALDRPPNDCDVVFQGYQLNQPGILDAVRQAELKLGIEPFPDWEFENTTAVGYSGNFYDDNIGQHSYHTDYLTMLMLNSAGKLRVGHPQTLVDLDNRTHDIYFKGVEIWAKHRGQGRSYASCITGDLIRALVMCHSLDLTPSLTTAFLVSHFDDIFNSLEPDDQMARTNFWLKKTQGHPMYQPILDQFGVTSLPIRQDKI